MKIFMNSKNSKKRKINHKMLQHQILLMNYFPPKKIKMKKMKKKKKKKKNQKMKLFLKKNSMKE